jgi:hypothetical protein
VSPIKALSPLLSCSLLFAPAAPSLTAGNQNTSDKSKRSRSASTTAPRETEFQIRVANIAGGAAPWRLTAPLRTLSESLNDFPTVTRFRVMWSMELANVAVKSTAIYDRSHNTLKYYEVGRFYGSPVGESWLYTGVTENMLHKLAAKYRMSKSGGPDSYLSKLTTMGAKRVKL